MSPEVLSGQHFNEKADVYSFGIVLWQVLTREEPFSEFQHLNEFRLAICNKKVRPEIPKDTLPRLAHLMRDCWQEHPASRPSFDSIVSTIDHLVVESSVRDLQGVRLWTQYFSKKDVVAWNEFVSAFANMVLQTNLVARLIKLREVPLGPTPSLTELRGASLAQLQEYGTRSEQNGYVMAHELQARLPSLSVHGDVNNLLNLNPYCMSELERRCLQAMLGEKPKLGEGMRQAGADDHVSLERFGRVLDWFGPIIDPHGRIILFDTMIGIMKHSWFFGELTTREAEQRLQQQQVGTFLVRFSSTNDGCYTISKMSSQGINHQRVTKIASNPPLFSLGNHQFTSLESLIGSMCSILCLSVSCPGHPFDQLFRIGSSSLGYIPSSYLN
eukprot:TRINITY_DN712_c0_g1_i2.p1 TRINITY_DN712_c0_g1~~TRINITY_DN712_c0_g1_i2.p1  ORF type:complete len:385 (+),score=76.42 TRINITY_DN712_c0_g1_i2:579-1733(+)